MLRSATSLAISSLFIIQPLIFAQQHAGEGEVSYNDRVGLKMSEKEIEKARARNAHDLEAALRKYKAAKNRLDSAYAAYKVGRIKERPFDIAITPDFSKGIHWYQIAAESGADPAAFDIAWMIGTGEWVLDRESIPKLIPLMQWASQQTKYDNNRTFHSLEPIQKYLADVQQQYPEYLVTQQAAIPVAQTAQPKKQWNPPQPRQTDTEPAPQVRQQQSSSNEGPHTDYSTSSSSSGIGAALAVAGGAALLFWLFSGSSGSSADTTPTRTFDPGYGVTHGYGSRNCTDYQVNGSKSEHSFLSCY